MPADRQLHLARHVLEAVVVWLGLMGLLAITYEVVDRLWLGGLPVESRDAARLFRVLAMSLTATVVTAVWMLWRRIPSLQRSLAVPAEPSTAPVSSHQVSLGQWFLGLRWVALVVLGAMVVVVTTMGHPHVPPESILPLWLGTSVLLFLDVGLLLMPDRVRSHPDLLLAQVIADVLIIAWLLHHAGGLANPFAAFYVFHAVIAGILLDARRARVAIVAIAGVIVTQTIVEGTSFLPPACVSGLDGICREADPMHLGAAGIGLATLSVGCALFTLTLVRALSGERDRLFAARSELIEEREKLQSVIGCMADAVIFADTRGSVVMHNPAAAKLWESRPGAGEDLRVCHNQETWARMLHKLLDPSELEVHPVLAIDGRFYEATYARVNDSAGELRGVVMVARDITERLESQDWRMRKERMAVVGKLAASLAHEINNPLGVVALYTQHALKKVSPTDPIHEHLETVLANANQASKIVRDLLTYSRQRPPERARLAVEDLVRDFTRTLGCMADRAGVSLRTEIVDGTPAVLMGDRDQLRQILVNLGLNAIDAMRGTGGEALLRVSGDGPTRLRFEVIDQGPGIAPEDHDKVFQAFHTTKSEGTGLGLAVAQDLARAHGGTVELESELGKGATFCLRLPISNGRRELEAAE